MNVTIDDFGSLRIDLNVSIRFVNGADGEQRGHEKEQGF